MFQWNVDVHSCTFQLYMYMPAVYMHGEAHFGRDSVCLIKIISQFLYYTWIAIHTTNTNHLESRLYNLICFDLFKNHKYKMTMNVITYTLEQNTLQNVSNSTIRTENGINITVNRLVAITSTKCFGLKNQMFECLSRTLLCVKFILERSKTLQKTI